MIFTQFFSVLLYYFKSCYKLCIALSSLLDAAYAEINSYAKLYDCNKLDKLAKRELDS